MQKFLTFLAANFILISLPLHIAGCNNNNSELKTNKTPNWIYNMAKNNSKKIKILFYKTKNKISGVSKWQKKKSN